MANLQRQGVPIPDKLNGPNPNGPSANRTATSSRTSRGSSPRRSSSSASKSVSRGQSRSTNVSDYNPATVGANASSGVGLLEAEFVLALGILILLMFSSSASTADKIMSTMKRGTLACALFFLLALIAGIGPNASKVAKAFGALVIIAIIVTSPIYTPGQDGGPPTGLLPDLDNIIKNDWVPTTEQGTDTAAISSADAGTSAGTSGSATTIASGLEKELKAIATPAKASGNPVNDAFINTLNGIIPGLGNLVKNGGEQGAVSVIKGILGAL